MFMFMNMCMCMYLYLYLYIKCVSYMHVYQDISTYVYTYRHNCKKRKHIHIWTCMYSDKDRTTTWKSIFIYAHIHMCIYTRICIHIYNDILWDEGREERRKIWRERERVQVGVRGCIERYRKWDIEYQVWVWASRPKFEIPGHVTLNVNPCELQGPGPPEPMRAPRPRTSRILVFLFFFVFLVFWRFFCFFAENIRFT